MKVIIKYVNEISGEEFEDDLKATKSEVKSAAIKELFAFVKQVKDKSCDFANGKWCVQRTPVYRTRLIQAIITAVNKFEPWIVKIYKKHGGLKPEHVTGRGMLGRYLGDGHSELAAYHNGVLATICSKCCREWGQPYYAIHCLHQDGPRYLHG